MIGMQGFSSSQVRLPAETSVESAGPRPLKRRASDALPAEGPLPQQLRTQGPFQEVLSHDTSSPVPSSQKGSVSEEADYSSDARQTASAGQCLCACDVSTVYVLRNLCARSPLSCTAGKLCAESGMVDTVPFNDACKRYMLH